ncbi:MAG: serine/threonine-protein kinase [Sphingomicrobium sp.]
MNKAYSNKALPAGTVLREWRLEEVLGVGGFGIVYKARGIYFDELVAIKEYFPSAISERDSDATVVPIDSDAEEVHALGLKKFVEEAKLLWNLSTPTRHPNIVSVRSLFEIHGTAYIVMDFEDGISLSKMLKQGRRFNERSLWNILRPIAEGLERAHRVGVLHRDIKPPNILINEENLPVLIDFGSARFAAAEATSTTVTFHTPPYAAIEQYVKTYPQGPWTDIYALGVVMYECVTGEKPPEVLERLHAGLGQPLASAKWPGYSKKFLASIDAAMVVKPEERPQSINDWLAMFGKGAESADSTDAADEATRFYAGQVETPTIVPVPATPNLDLKTPLETSVPADPKEARFKRAGQETAASKKLAAAEAAGKAQAAAAEAEPAPAEPAAAEPAAAAPARGKNAAMAAAATAATPAPGKPDRSDAKTGEKAKPRTAVMAGLAVAVLAAGVGALALRGGGPEPASIESSGTPAGDDSAAIATALGTSNMAIDTNADSNSTEGMPVEQAELPADNQAAELKALRSEHAKTAAAEAKLVAARRAAAKSAAAELGAKAPNAARTAESKAEAAEKTASSAGVSSAKLSQLNASVDEGRSMAKRVMRSSNRANAQLAKNYDQYLKSLKSSIRGVQTEKEADTLLKQANQTKAYIQFLLKQE